MKHLCLIVAFVIGLQITYATETEPNNTSAQANTLALNGSNTGKINTGGDLDWWKVTTNNDGRLSITLSNSSGKDISVSLYDNNGTTLLVSGDSTATFLRRLDGLAVGTYYIKVSCVSATDTASYTIGNTLAFPAAQPNDAEPDNVRTQALALNLNSTVTGHVGFYYNNVRDTSDWYKIIPGGTSKLRLKFTPTNGQSLTVSLYANNGLSLINTASATSTFSLITDGLKSDLYYVKVNASSSGGYAPYILTDSTYTATTDSIILPLNFGTRDRVTVPGAADWWKVSVNADGKLNFNLTPLSGKYVWLYLYDNDRTTILNSAYSNGAFVVNTDGLAAGNYFVKVVPYYATDTSSYYIADTLTRPAQANDAEPNGTKAQALTLNLNSSRTGHAGYYFNHNRDSVDWYKVTTNADGQLNLNLTPANGTYIWIYLYDNDGTTLLNSNYSNAGFNVNSDGLAAGTYYIKVNCYYNNGFAPYTLSNNLVLPAVANDIEPDNTQAQALTLNLNSSKTGHVGYYYNNRRDSVDWYRITTNADGQLNLNLTPANGSYIWVYLYDNDSTTLVNSNYSNAAFSLNTNGLAAGTYYLKVNCYYNNQFTPYTLSNNLVLPAQANDGEPNNTRAQALAFNVNSTRTGHSGYYYNNKRDSADWYRITTSADGMLKLSLTPVNGVYMWIYLYDNDGTTLINSADANAGFNLNTDGLAAGTYYLKINCYYNNQFTPYILTDSLFTYNANDVEPNKNPYQGAAITPNSTTTGHVNFYYNRVKDSLDWRKLNYTGSGNLQFVFNLTPKKINGSIPYTWFYVYRDTLAAPVYSNYFNTASNVINLSSLSKTTYYIKVITYYQSDFVTYSIANSFTPSLQRAVNEAIPLTTSDINIYPNPVSSRLHIQASGKQDRVSSIILRDADGKQVMSQSNIQLSKGGGLDIDVNKLPSGTYFLQVTDVNKTSTIKKIVIVR